MSFAIIGGLMLMVVLLFYWRMFSLRNPNRMPKSKADEVLEQVQVFESLAKDKEALAYLNKALQNLPGDELLLLKKEEIAKRLNEQNNRT